MSAARGYISVKDFKRFQHYRDRRPAWIKLYNDLLDDYEFGCLPDASKWLAVGIWLLASRHENRIPADPEWIGRMVHASSPVDLTPLLNAGFITVSGADSNALAERKQPAIPEGETEGEEEEAVGQLDGVHVLRAQSDVDPEHLITLAIRAANAGMADNSAIDQDRCRPILPQHGRSRQIAREWFDAGYAWDAVMEEVYFAAVEFRPDELHAQITSLTYFKAPVRDRAESDASRAIARPVRTRSAPPTTHPDAEVNSVRGEMPGAGRIHQAHVGANPISLTRLMDEMRKQGFEIPKKEVG